jgi:HK97 family phage prohead protease
MYKVIGLKDRLRREQRAYSRFETKSVNDSLRILEGLATTPTPDRLGDVVEVAGAQFELPLPFLWQHDAGQPVGEVIEATPTKAGISVRVRIARSDEPGTLKDRLDMAWQSIKMKLVRGLSIGFAPLEYSYMEETGGYRFIKWAWLELSAVTVPANAEASIATIKSFDRRPPHVRITLPAPAKGIKARAAEYVEVAQGVMDEW